jgi:hypothetical protein
MPTRSKDPRLQLTGSDGSSGIVDDLARIGYAASFRPGVDDGTMICPSCGTVSPVSRFGDVWATRLEGQSDPDDMVLVVAARCPACHDGGSIVLGFGPAGSAEDAAVVAQIPDHAMHHLNPGT